MNWKAVVAIVLLSGLALGIGVWWGGRQGAEEVMKRDVAAAAEAARLRSENEKHRAAADTLTAELGVAYETIDDAKGALETSQNAVKTWRRRAKSKPASTAQECQEDCEAVIAKLDSSLTLAYDVIFAQDVGLKLCEQRDIERLGHIEGCEQVDVIQTKRVKTWQQQTRRGRVKTAFFGIGMAAAGGSIGYVAGRYTQ